MKNLIFIVFTILLFTSLNSQVRHSINTNGDPVVDINITSFSKSYVMQEYHPDFDLKFYSSEKGFGNRIIQPKTEFYYYSDDNSFLFITKSNNENIGTFTLKKDNSWKNFDIYNDRIEEHMPKEFDCKALETGSIPGSGDFISGKCAKLYTEWDYNFFQQAGSLNSAMSRIQAILAQSQWVFDRDSIRAEYNEVFIWTVPDPYTGTSSTQQLSLFRTYHQPFTDDLAQLCEINPGGLGGVAYLSGFCTSYNVSYADINYSYNNVPSYSWTINVITHEFGHLLGSRHTHWCGWTDNGITIGALDNCAPLAGYPTEGGCVPGPAPTSGGTMMSYCHLVSYGINFNNGFGYYPRRAIWTAINNATCLDYCDSIPPPTNCNDVNEPNNVKENSKSIIRNNNYQAGLDVTDDIDWYKFNTAKNSTNINLTFTNLSASTVLELYQNTSLVKTITGNGSITISYNATWIGTYYVKAAAASGKLNGCYNVSLMLGKRKFAEVLASVEPDIYLLEQNYPNPFNSSTKISFKIPGSAGNARIIVYDILGKEIFNNSINNSDGYVIFDMSSDKFASGLYFYKLIADNYVSDFKKLVLIK